jgi:hypothetical protein
VEDMIEQIKSGKFRTISVEDDRAYTEKFALMKRKLEEISKNIIEEVDCGRSVMKSSFPGSASSLHDVLTSHFLQYAEEIKKAIL